MKFDSNVSLLSQHPDWAFDNILVQVGDVIEQMKLELELDGRDQIGNAYAPGDYYDYFRDLKEIIAGAKAKILIVDPYFNGEAFDAYLSEVRGVEVMILASTYSGDTKTHADKHSRQHGSTIYLRQSDELHDRLIIVDGGDC